MKRLPLLLLAVGCWSSVQATHDWETGGLDKRSAEEEDCLVDCKKDTILSVQACLQRCKITKRSIEEASPPYEGPPSGPPGGGFGHGKRSAEESSCLTDCMQRAGFFGDCTNVCRNYGKRSAEDSPCMRNCQAEGSSWSWCVGRCVGKRSAEDEKLSVQDPPPQPWQVNGPGKRSAGNGVFEQMIEERRRHCAFGCRRMSEPFTRSFCLERCNNITKRSVSAQDPPPQPWQVNGPGKRSDEQYRPWSGNYSDLLHVDEEERVAYERHNCTLECYKRTNFSRSACHHICNNRTKRSVSAQDPPPQPWQVNGPGKRSAEESSCWGDCVARGGHSGNCAQACQGCFPPQCYYRGHGKRSAEEGDCAQKCDREWRKCRSQNFVPTACRNPGCVDKCEATKRSTEDEKLSAQDPPPQPWQVNGPGKRSVEEEDCLVDCKKDTKLSVQACLQKCKITKRSIEETLGL